MRTQRRSAKFAKVVVCFEERDDGGLRAYSKDVPGFVLSHPDRLAVIRDVKPALETILSAMWGIPIEADMLATVSEFEDDDDGIPDCSAPREYVAHAA